MKNFKKNNSGFTLVETLVALAIFSVSIVSLISVTASGVANTNFAKNKLTASYLSQEGVELVRNFRDSTIISGGGWSAFVSGLPAQILIFNNIADPNLSQFTRDISVTPVPGANAEVQIISTVSWSQGAGERSVTYKENLLDWIQIGPTIIQ